MKPDSEQIILSILAEAESPMTGYEIQKIWGKGIGGLYIILHDLEHEGAVRHLVADYHGISRKHWEIRRGGLVRREFLAA